MRPRNSKKPLAQYLRSFEGVGRITEGRIQNGMDGSTIVLPNTLVIALIMSSYLELE